MPNSTGALTTTMDDQPAKNTSDDKINKIDLSAFEAFEFGTQWSEASSGAREDRSAQQRTGRERQSGPGAGPPRRDRRPPRREMQTAENRSRGPGGAQTQTESRGRPDRRPPPRHGPGHAPGRAGDDRGHQQGRRDDRQDFRGRPPRGHSGPPRPYQSPVFEITFYPDDHGFNALVKAMRASCRTYELFEIARLILEKPERCVVVFKRRKSSPDAPAAPLFVSVPDSMPFDTEEEAIRYALDKHMDKFFTMETVEVEPPKGNFQFVNRCPVTKQLLGPPNYHRYPHILQHHYETHAIRQSFEEYKLAVEVVKEPEIVQQWIESTKTATRYTLKGPEGSEPLVFESPEDARTHLLAHCRDQIVRAADSARLPAKVVTEAGRCEAEHALQGAVEMQRRFPLDTANALRGRLRRENFHIFKRGSKGVTYVCSVRRKFRKPGEVFSDSITRVVEFLDKHPRISIADLPEKFLGFSLPHHPAGNAPIVAAQVPAEAEAEAATGETPAEAPGPVEPQVAGPTPEQRAALDRMIMDLRWLVGEGYVAEYSDGRLYVHPTMEPSEAKSSADSDDHHDGESHPSEQSEPSESQPEPAAAAPESEPVASEPAAEVEPAAASESAPAPAPETAAEPEPETKPEPEAATAPPVPPPAPPAEEPKAPEPQGEPAEESSPEESSKSHE